MATSSKATLGTPQIVAMRRAYLAALPPRARRAVNQLREAVRAAVPNTQEWFSYRMPGFRLNERPVVWCAGFANHVSLYPMTADIRKAHAAALKSYKVSIGTVQFALTAPLPVRLVRRLVRARAAEVRRAARA
jgi:uncharacterized protein YdhG (YjbR/CyaY superfamily)